MKQPSSKTSPTLRASDIIKDDAINALKVLAKRWSLSGSDIVLDEGELDAVARIELAIADYADLSRKIEKSVAGGIKKRIGYASSMMLDTAEARIVAVVRSFAHEEKISLPSEILKTALSFSVWQPLKEIVRVHWQRKADGGFRPICAYGPLRRAQGLMVRDVLMIAGIDVSTNFAKRGSGGERGLTQKVCSLINEGQDWWWTPDIKSAFPSMRPGHFRWLAIDRRLLLNVAYLPKCAKIEVKLPSDAEAFSAYLKVLYPDLKDGICSLTDIAQLVVRRGLPQGSLLSPLLAGALIARLWSQSNSLPKAVMLSWHDDLNVGTETKAQIKQIKEKLIHHLGSLPAGPIELHESPIVPAISGRVTVLGYRLQPGRGHVHYADGSRSIHVKPGKKRLERYKKRLAERLVKINDAKARIVMTEAYTKSWFASQQAWTKVPNLSWMNAEVCGLTYYQDFENGQTMGGGWVV